METAITNSTIKSKSRFLQALFLLVLTLAIAMGSQPALAQTAPCTLTDIDQDDDGLIEICDLEGLNAIRYQLDGSGYKASGSATKITVGCPATGCKGYELTRDLDFKDDGSYRDVSLNKRNWSRGWEPVGADQNNFNSIFEGNGYIIYHLKIFRRSVSVIGLFARTGNQSKITNVGLLNMFVWGQSFVGGLVGINKGSITNSYATGYVKGWQNADEIGGLVGRNNGFITNSHATSSVTGRGDVGGLVGWNSGSITNSYATGSVTGNGYSADVGGLVGYNGGGSVTNSYATGSVTGTGDYAEVGGLIGDNGSGSVTNSYATSSVTGTSDYADVGGLIGDRGSVTNSYWDKTTSGATRSAGGIAKTTTQLQEPTTPTGIYSSWNVNVWDFGTTKQYPVLKHKDGTVMPNQVEVKIAGVPSNVVHEGERITLTASSPSSASLSYRWVQISDGVLLVTPTTQSNITFEIPKDYVSANMSATSLVLSLDGIDGNRQIAQKVAITVVKRNNGKITALGAPSLNERELEAPAIDLSGDPDGGSSNIGYQWQSREETQSVWSNVPAGTSEAYTIPENVFGTVRYRMVVRYTDGQGYSERLISQVVAYERGYSLAEMARLTSCGTTDIDQDDDGLIEICNLEGLNAMRYQMDGTGYRPIISTMKITSGCANTGCKGYELSRDLDFNDDDSYSSTSNKIIWTTGSGWQPIGHSYEDIRNANNNPFVAIFDGNGYTISHLMINRIRTTAVGLFGYAGNQSSIINIGLLNINVIGHHWVGGLVGANEGAITNSYATGAVTGTRHYADVGGLVGWNINPGSVTKSYAMVDVIGNSYGANVGGLVGWNGNSITNSYATGSVTGTGDSADVGGLVGYNNSSSRVTNSYAIGSVTGGRDAGGLVGYNSRSGRVTNSYWDKLTSGITTSAGGEGKTTIELQSSTATTGTYTSWSTEIWDFGTTKQYPALKYRSGMFIPNQGRVQPENVPQVEAASLTSCGTTDIDQDNDGLIEICNLEGLNAIRYQLDGTGYKASRSATKITVGCPNTGCKGYELAQDLDFNDDDSYSSTPNKITWTTGTGWQPIGTGNSPFNATFKANKHSISSLMIDRPSANNIGLFGRVGGSARIEGVALIDVNVRGNWGVGSLVGLNSSGSVIHNSYATGTIRGGDSAGGLVGDNHSRITNSYTNISVSGGSYIGGIVGCNFSGGAVSNSYTVSSISSTGVSRGGILGYNGADSSSVLSSYWDMDVSGISSGADGLGRTTIQLQSPTTATGIYSSWSTNVWDFGTSEQYPALKYSDGTVLPNQGRVQPEDVPQMPPQVEIAGVPTSSVGEGEVITLTASPSDTANNTPLNYSWSQTSGGGLLLEPTTQRSVTIELPEDYVSAGANTVNLAIMLEAVSDVGSTSQHVSITIAKRNNGKIAALGVPSLNERELEAPTIDLSGDPDGGGSDIGYQWQSRASTATAWANVMTVADTKETYTIPDGIRSGMQYRVVISYTDGQSYREEVISPAVIYERIDLPISIVNPVSCGPNRHRPRQRRLDRDMRLGGIERNPPSAGRQRL